MRRRPIAIVLVALAAGTWYTAVPPRARVLPPPRAALPMPVRGVIHVHTSRSDGTGTPDEVAAAASRAGLQFVITTDHGDGTRAPDPPSYRSGVLCIDAVEISTNGGHLLALGLGATPYPLGGESRDVVEDVLRMGGLSLIAHPISEKAELNWTDWTEPFGGLEWLNGDTEWRDERPMQLARALLSYPFRKPEALALLLDRSDAVMRQWDALTRARRVVAVAGADAHARIPLAAESESYRSPNALHLPGYEAMFRTFSVALPQAVLSGDAVTDARAVVEELRQGRVYSAIDAVAGPVAFAFSATSGKHRAVAGEALTIDVAPSLHVDAQAPADALISLIQDGQQVLETQGSTLGYMAEPRPAVYRVEVKLPGAPGEPPVPWIVSNPIYVGRKSVDGPAPKPRKATSDAESLYRDGAVPDWRIERGPTSDGAVDVIKAVPGTQLLFRYALSGVASAGPYAALVAPAGPRVSRHDRLSFRARADHPMRLSVQLRAPGPGPGPGERWARSVFLDEVSRDVTVFFEDLLPRGATSTPRPDLSRVESILFVVDTVNTRTGTAGQVWLDDIRYER
jgi:hypothetical protein